MLRLLWIVTAMLIVASGAIDSDQHALSAQENQDDQAIPFYIGTYTRGSSQGIYRSSLNLETGALEQPKLVAELENPSFLAIHPTLPVLYAVSEVRRQGKRESSQVMAYSIASSGSLSELGGVTSGGDGPCYVSTDRAGEFVFVANYGSGSITSIKLHSNGSLAQVCDTIQHAGSSVNEQRQSGPHAHCIMTDPSDNFVCAVDLGLDQVIVYKLDRETGKLAATDQPFKATPGNGPRHLAFHPDGKHAFVINEMASTLSALTWDSETGLFEEVDTVSTVPEDFTDSNSTAEVLVHPNGQFVFGSNRGHDSIAAFSWSSKQKKLIPAGHTPSGGTTPRNFRIDPTGQFLLTENQNSDSIFAFQVNESNGELTSVGNSLEIGAPCCIKFYQR